MDVWKRVVKVVERGVEASRELLDKTGEVARDVGHRGKLRIDLARLESQLTKLATQIGTRVYELLCREQQNAVGRGHEQLADLLNEMSEIEAEILEKESELQREQKK